MSRNLTRNLNLNLHLNLSSPKGAGSSAEKGRSAWPWRGVYTFPLFSDEYCAALIAEVEHFQRSGLPVRRPNSMNNYGLIVNEIGRD